MRSIFLLLNLISIINLFAQEKYMVDTLSINENTKLIGRHPPYYKPKSYNLNFIIENPKEIKEAIKAFKIKEKTANNDRSNVFWISIIQDNHELILWQVNPEAKSFYLGDLSYSIDIDIIKALHEKFPFEYRDEEKVFKTKEEFTAYFEEQKKNKNFLFNYGPEFLYEGSFEVVFPTNDKSGENFEKKVENFEKTMGKISNYLKPRIEKIDSISKNRISYNFDTKDWNDPTKITISVEGSRKLFDNLILKNPIKQNWKYTIESGSFYYKVTNANKSYTQ
ncbi:MAG: hypothetical protein ABFS35_15180 [Bacteroidota bacterium]